MGPPRAWSPDMPGWMDGREPMVLPPEGRPPPKFGGLDEVGLEGRWGILPLAGGGAVGFGSGLASAALTTGSVWAEVGVGGTGGLFANLGGGRH